MKTDTPPCPLTDCQFNDPNFTGHCSAEVADEPLYPDCKKRIQAVTPPQPAHGEPKSSEFDDPLHPTQGALNSPWVMCDQYGEVSLEIKRSWGKEYIGEIMRRDHCLEIIGRLNLLAPHPDLSAVEVHSKETMDEVRGVLKLFEQISSIQKPALLGGWNWPQLNKQAESALANLNPPL